MADALLHQRVGRTIPYEALPPARQYTSAFIEAQRPQFEADMRAHWPSRSLERWGDTYKRSNTRCQWLGWLSCATAMGKRRG